MTTTTNGTFRTCGEGSFSLTYTCSGPSCTYLNGFPNTTCTTSGSVLSCSNGVTCDATDYTYTSDFTYNQEQSLVTQTQNVQLGICGNFIISSDGTPGGTTSEVTDPGVVSCGSPSNSSTSSSYLMSSSQAPYTNQTTTLPFNTSALTSTSSQSKTTTGPPTTTTPVSFTGAASFQRPPRASIFLVFLLLASLFIQGATAANQPSDIVPARSDPIAPILISDNQNITSIELFRRASTEDPAQLVQDWEDVAKIIGEYVGGKLTKLTEKQQQLFEENFVNEIANAICVHYTGMYANQLITKIIGADLVEACITSALTIAVFDPPAELLAIFAASTMCNAIVGYIFDHTPVLSTITGMVDELCKIPKPCGNPDTLTDPLNCGFCNNTVCGCLLDLPSNENSPSSLSPGSLHF
jgi:hypothetical protein